MSFNSKYDIIPYNNKDQRTALLKKAELEAEYAEQELADWRKERTRAFNLLESPQDSPSKTLLCTLSPAPVDQSDLSLEIAPLTFRGDGKQEKLVQIQEEIQRYQEVIENLQQELSLFDEDQGVYQLEQQLKEIEDKLDAKGRQIGKINKQISAKQKKSDKLKMQFDQSKANRTKIQKGFNDLQQNLLTIKEQAREEVLREIKEQMDASVSQNKENRCSSCERPIKKSPSKAARRSPMRNNHIQVQAQIKKLENNRKKLQRDISNIKSQSGKIETEKLNEVRATKENECKKLQEEVEEYKGKCIRMALRSLGSIKKLKMKQKELKLLAVRSHKEIEERLKIRKRY